MPASKKIRVKRAVIDFLTSGNILLLILGVFFSAWLDYLFSMPELVLIAGLAPFSINGFQYIIVPFCLLFLPFLILVWKFFKNSNYVWFFAGASLTSFYFAIISFLEVSVVWYLNHGNSLSDFYVETPLPAIYAYKLFKSIFFASLFGLLGNWSQILRRSKNSPKKHVSLDRFVGDDI